MLDKQYNILRDNDITARRHIQRASQYFFETNCTDQQISYSTCDIVYFYVKLTISEFRILLNFQGTHAVLAVNFELSDSE